MFKKTLARRAAVAVAMCGISACTGGLITIAPTPPPAYQQLGHATGTGCGTMLLAYPAYNFIPVMLGSRSERAYSNAVESVPGATSLVDVTLRESWYWWILGTTRCVTIEGEAIK